MLNYLLGMYDRICKNGVIPKDYECATTIQFLKEEKTLNKDFWSYNGLKKRTWLKFSPRLRKPITIKIIKKINMKIQG